VSDISLTVSHFDVTVPSNFSQLDRFSVSNRLLLSPFFFFASLSHLASTSLLQCIILSATFGLEPLLSLSDYCHRKSIPLILCDVRGLFSFVFVDLGSRWEATGMDQVSGIEEEVREREREKRGRTARRKGEIRTETDLISRRERATTSKKDFLAVCLLTSLSQHSLTNLSNISSSSPTVVTFVDYRRHPFSEGEVIEFVGLTGQMSEKLAGRKFTVRGTLFLTLLSFHASITCLGSNRDERKLCCDRRGHICVCAV
jgi:hypothetical protein